MSPETSKGSILYPPKESIHLRQSQVLKIQGARGKVVGLNWTDPHFEIPKEQKLGLAQFGPTQWWVWRTPYFLSGPPRLDKSVNFLWWRLYINKEVESRKCIQHARRFFL